MRRANLAPLRIRPFRRILGVDCLNHVGDWLGAIALAVLVFGETGDPLAVALLFLFLKALPALASPALSARLEALRVSVSLPLIYVGEATVFVALALTSKAFWLPAVLALALVDGALALAGQTLVRSSVAAVLEPSGKLREGNALLNLVFTLGFAAGPALGGLAVATLGIQAALLINAATFAAAAALLAVTRGLPQGNPAARRWRAHLARGLRFVRKDPALTWLILGYGALIVFAAAANPVEVVFAKQTLGTGDLGYGLLLASWGAGAAVGGLIFLARSGTSLYTLALLSSIAEGVAYLGASQAPTLTVALGFFLAGGVGNGVQWAAVTTAIQERAGSDAQARVVAIHNALAISLAPGLAYILGGAVAAAVSARAAIALAGAGVLAVTVTAIPVLYAHAAEERQRLAGGELKETGDPADR